MRNYEYLIALLGWVLAVTVTGCSSVDFYQKAHFSDPIMTFDPDPTELHVYQKTYYSREGSAGGIGASAGGGCGCY